MSASTGGLDREQVFVEHPGAWIADRLAAGRRVGVAGLDYVMAVRDYRALDGPAEVVPFDEQFDLARAVKSEAELESVREGMRINDAGVGRAEAPTRSAGPRPS